MIKLEELVPGILVSDFWRVVNALDETIDGKNYKGIIAQYFHPDGKSKKNIQSLQTDKQIQDWNEVNNFILSNVIPKMHIQRLRDRKEQRKQEIREKKEANRARHQLARGGRGVEES